MPGWYLDDAAAIAASAPYTFYKPPAEVIGTVRPGELVKLVFCFESDDASMPRAERMWVIVDTVDGEGGFTGRLDNQPRYIRDLDAGTHIAFRDIHIINTCHDEHDNLVEKYIARCFVTQRILRDGDKVGYLYRESPDHEDDSGWRLMAGDESQEYMDDTDNVAYVSLGSVLNHDDSFVHLLDAEAGAAFERSDDGNDFVKLPPE